MVSNWLLIDMGTEAAWVKDVRVGCATERERGSMNSQLNSIGMQWPVRSLVRCAHRQMSIRKLPGGRWRGGSKIDRLGRVGAILLYSVCDVAVDAGAMNVALPEGALVNKRRDMAMDGGES